MQARYHQLLWVFNRLLPVHPPDLGSEGDFSLINRLPGTIFPQFSIEWCLLGFVASHVPFRDIIPTSPVVTFSGLYGALKKGGWNY